MEFTWYIIVGLVLLYFIIGAAFFVLIVKLEKANVIKLFGVKGEENGMCICSELLWPILALALLLVLPAGWAKKYLKDHY